MMFDKILRPISMEIDKIKKCLQKNLLVSILGFNSSHSNHKPLFRPFLKYV